MYEVYMQGSSNPVWVYRSYTWLRKRLEYLARMTAVSWVTVKVNDEQIIVMFARDGKSWGWSAEPKGIPHGQWRAMIREHQEGGQV